MIIYFIRQTHKKKMPIIAACYYYINIIVIITIIILIMILFIITVLTMVLIYDVVTYNVADIPCATHNMHVLQVETRSSNEYINTNARTSYCYFFISYKI